MISRPATRPLAFFAAACLIYILLGYAITGYLGVGVAIGALAFFALGFLCIHFAIKKVTRGGRRAAAVLAGITTYLAVCILCIITNDDGRNYFLMYAPAALLITAYRTVVVGKHDVAVT